MTVLIILSSHDQFGDTGKKTGTWLEELLVPYYRLIDAGISVDIASPSGGSAPIDPWSVELYESDPIFARYSTDGELNEKLAKTSKLTEIDPAKYDAVLYPGGHGPLYDLRYDEASRQIIRTMLDADKLVGVICHAGCVLADVLGPDGQPLVRGRSLTAFTDSEEAAVGLTDAVPYSVEADLRALGSAFSSVEDWGVNVVIDGRLITGQNPASAGAVADALIKELRP